MLKNLCFAAIAAGLVAAVALPVHVTPAEAAEQFISEVEQVTESS